MIILYIIWFPTVGACFFFVFIIRFIVSWIVENWCWWWLRVGIAYTDCALPLLTYRMYSLYLYLKSSSLSNVCFIAGKTFNIINTTLKIYVFFSYWVRSKLYIVSVVRNVILNLRGQSSNLFDKDLEAYALLHPALSWIFWECQYVPVFLMYLSILFGRIYMSWLMPCVYALLLLWYDKPVY